MSESYRVLLVDDDAVDRMAVRRALRAGGVAAEIVEADDGATALRLLREQPFDCVLLDFRLPGADGLGVVREARAAGITIPLVVLTGQADDVVAAELIKAGATDYLTKAGMTPERLTQVLRQSVRVWHAEEQARAAEAALRESEARFRVLHETSPDGFVILKSIRDESGQIVDFRYEYLNPATERISGRPAAERLGRRLLEDRPGVRDSGLFDLFRKTVETGEPQQTEVRYASEGMDLWVRVTTAELGDGVAVGYSDITRRKQAEEERERAIAARSRFYAAMSHELRTPINAILGYTDLLLAGAYGEMDPVQLGGVERAHRAARHLQELVNDVLDLSKLEAGKLELVVEPTDVPQLVDDLFATVRPMAEERGSELRLRDTGCGGPILTDPRRVRQILLNLLSNAIKFGEARPVEIRCGQAEDGGVAVEVVDHGIGIDPKDLPRIFEEFVQLPGADQRGTGLGLAISRRLADLLGGRLEVESQRGEGSVFRLVLPREAPTA